MLTTIIALILATEPAPAIGATETTHACQSSSVERPALAMPAPEWAFVLPRSERACDVTEDAVVTMAAMGFADPFADVVHEPDVVLPDGGADAPTTTEGDRR
jgi:hypothetical protein